jgi:hypothetical protein
MLIEILLDDNPNTKQSDRTQITQEMNVFLNTHLNSSSSSLGLLELNQLFLKRMVNNITPSSSHNNQQQQKYKVEDLKAERMDFFDQQLSQKRTEFEAAITLKKPPTPVFEDQPGLDIPILNMETLLAQRNKEMSSFLNAPNQQKPADWLTPASTSVKLEKQEKEDERPEFETVPTDTIFSRLKKQTPPDNQDITLDSSSESLTTLTNRVIKLEMMFKQYLISNNILSDESW